MFDPVETSMKGLVSRGAVVTGLSQAVRIASQLGMIVILSRLLTPADFGIVAMTGPILVFVTMFQNLGLTQATVQKPAITQGEVNSLFWVNIAVTVLLSIGLMLASPLASIFYNEPKVTALTAAMAAVVLATGIGAQHGAILNRRMEFKALAIVDTLAALSTILVSIGWAVFVRQDYWAVFAGMFAGAAILSSGYWIMAKWTPSAPAFTRESRGLLHFGAGVTGANICTFVSRNLDNVLIGKVWGEVPLGLYDRAYKLFLFPLLQITIPLSRIMVPALSRLAQEPDRYRNAFLRAQGQLLLLIVPGIAFMLATAEILIPVCLGEQWRGSVPIFQALGFAGLLQAVNNPIAWLYLSQGRARELFLVSVATAVTNVAAFVIGLPKGPVGVAIAYSICEGMRTPFLWWFVTRRGPLSFGLSIRIMAPHVIGGFAVAGVLYYFKRMLPLPDLVTLGLCLALAYALSFTLLAATKTGRDVMRETWDLAAGFLKRKL